MFNSRYVPAILLRRKTFHYGLAENSSKMVEKYNLAKQRCEGDFLLGLCRKCQAEKSKSNTGGITTLN